MSAIKKAVVPMMILVVLTAILFWVMNAKKLNDRIPSRGVFVFSEDMRCNLPERITKYVG